MKITRITIIAVAMLLSVTVSTQAESVSGIYKLNLNKLVVVRYQIASSHVNSSESKASGVLVKVLEDGIVVNVVESTSEGDQKVVSTMIISFDKILSVSIESKEYPEY